MNFDNDTDVGKCTILDKLRFVLRILGSILSFMNLCGLIFYAMKHEFASHTLFDSFTGFIVLRFGLIFVLTLFMFFKNVIRYRVDHHKTDYTGSLSTLLVYGIVLYTTFPFMFWFGLYRVYVVKDFAMLIFINYCLEFFLQNIPLVFV